MISYEAKAFILNKKLIFAPGYQKVSGKSTSKLNNFKLLQLIINYLNALRLSEIWFHYKNRWWEISMLCIILSTTCDCIPAFLCIKSLANSGNGFVSYKICHVLQSDMLLIIISVLLVCWTQGIRIDICWSQSLLLDYQNRIVIHFLALLIL